MIYRFFFLLFVLASMVACKSKVPEDIVDKDTMVNLLYDYHLAQSLAKTSGDSVNYRTKCYIDAVYEKYGIDEATFNRTMAWYIRNSEELFKIYGKIDDKYAEATLSGKQLGNPYALMKAEGDTMNIWNGKNFYILCSSARNRLDFEIPVDTMLNMGDKLLWEFETQWLYREGQKNARMELALVYENDSVASSAQTIYSMGKQDLKIVVGNKKVKAIQGFVYQSTPWTEQPSLLTISEPVLVKFKKQKDEGTLTENISLRDKESVVLNSEKVEPKRIDASSETSENNNQRILRMPRHNR